MNILYSSEVSLRAAVISANKTTTNLEDFAENIKIHALNQIELVEKAEGLMSGIKSAESIEKAAISAAVHGIELAYKAISLGLQEGRSKRRQFVNECEKSLATFIIDNNKELHDLTTEELAIKNFYAILAKHSPNFIGYCGIHLRESDEFSNIQFFSILPFYKMSQAIPQNFMVDSKLDEYRQSIFHFLQTGLPLDYYYQRFINTSSVALKIGSLWFKKNYLNHYRAPRFIVTALANLLWNLQYPVNIHTGSPLSMVESTALAYDAEMLLNDLLNSRQFTYLEEIDSKSKRLNQCLFKIESSIKGLRESFEYEHLHEINLRDVCQHMHSALKIMSNKMLELIYQNELTGERLVGQIMMLSTLFIQNPLLYSNFNEYMPTPPPPHLNPEPCTIVDVLIIFSSLTPSKRFALCQKLVYFSAEAETQLAYQLKEFHNNFLAPFEGILFDNKDFKKDKKMKDFHFTASYFIPLIILIMESFKVFKDTRPSKGADEALDFASSRALGSPPKESPEFETQNRVTFKVTSESSRSDYDYVKTQSKNDKMQCAFILNDVSTPEDGNKYYNWSISMFLKKKSRRNQQIDELLIWQNQIREKTSRLDDFADVISKNRMFLQHQRFHTDLSDLLKEIRFLFDSISQKFSTIQTQMQSNTKLQRDEKRVLQPMLEDVSTIVESVEKSIQQVDAIISAPDFGALERQKMLEQNPLLQTYQGQAMGRFRNSVRNTPRRAPEEGLQAIAEEVHEPYVFAKALPNKPGTKSLADKPLSTLQIYGVNACLGLTELLLVQNLFSSYIQLGFAINILACFAALACVIAFNLYIHQQNAPSTQENQFHFKMPQSI